MYYLLELSSLVSILTSIKFLQIHYRIIFNKKLDTLYRDEYDLRKDADYFNLEFNEFYFYFLLSIVVVNLILGFEINSYFILIAICLVLIHSLGLYVINSIITRKKLENYLINKFQLPKSFIQFKVDAVKLIKSTPEHNLDYFYHRFDDNISHSRLCLDEDYTIPIESHMLDRDLNHKGFDFILLHKLRQFITTIEPNTIEGVNPLIVEYVIDNITLLTTFTTILKDEQMVMSLRSPLGTDKLEELCEKFDNLIEGLNEVKVFIEKENKNSENNKELNYILEGLNSINSIQEISDSVK